MSDRAKVLIVTGTLLSVKEPSVWMALRKQLEVMRASDGHWLDTHLKLNVVEALLAQRRLLGSDTLQRASYGPTVNRLLTGEFNLGAPELTEVVLMTALRAADVEYEAITYADLYGNDIRRERLLSECTCVFASTTLLRGLPEMAAVMPLLKRSHNRVVAGGALTGVMHGAWNGCPGVDVLAVGYGELLVPALVAWIRGDFDKLLPPERGRVVMRGNTIVVYSGAPADSNLDWLPRPEWSLAEKYHGATYPMVHYESVRGCPYRCAFCNYPFLFNDTKFRYKSAEKIAGDWAAYADSGARWITCLDSLFTIPRRRLIELCELLMKRQVKVKWICYARADDLLDPTVCTLMHDAGCIQVQIGAESGNQRILDNMNKQCTVETNHRAIVNCREAGITTLASVIIGFPGETERSVIDTHDFLVRSQPDFYYAAPFSADVPYIPITQPESREKYGLRTSESRSTAGYWRHDTMSCTSVANTWKRFNTSLMRNRASLEASLFYKSILEYRPADREDLLDFQERIVDGFPVMRGIFYGLRSFAQWRLERDVARTLDG
jgi:radical SAM superfamily enzyme YgiQ (UPF0313 family)